MGEESAFAEASSDAKAMVDKSVGESDRLVLIDGNAILHRAYHALPPLTNRSGELVNAVYGFSSMLLRILDELKPKYIAVSFDTAKVSFRNEVFIGYKANRPKMDEELAGQIEKVYEVVRAFNIPIFTADGYEADDVIATLAFQAVSHADKRGKKKPLNNAEKVDEVLIVTGDKDLMQLVDGKVKLFMPAKGLSENQIIGASEVKEKMGVPPELIVDYKGLVGDPSDNYPGVPGIGPKTAIKLLEKFGSLEGIYRKLGEGFGGCKEFEGSITEKLKAGEESAVLSKKLATILTDIPVQLDLEKCITKDYDKQKVIDIFEQLRFRSLVGRIKGGNMKEKGKIEEEGNKDNKQQSLF